MNWKIGLEVFCSCGGAIAIVIGLMRWLGAIISNPIIKRLGLMEDRIVLLEDRFNKVDERIFQLAMGRSLKDILKEEKSRPSD